MGGKLAFIVLAALLSFATCTRLCMVSGVGSVIRVPADYSTIQEAINAALPGSTVVVSPGVYRENLVVDKTLNLTGEDKMTTIIDGDQRWTVVEIMADRVVLRGFTVQNSSQSQGAGGIFLNNSKQCEIKENIIIHNAPAGLTIWNNSSDNLIDGNIVAFNSVIFPGWIEGYNIMLHDSNNNTVTGNVLSNSVVCGLYLGNSNDTKIMLNTIENNSDGLIIYNSNNGTAHHNCFINNWYQLELIEHSRGNVWDDGHEGNYWDDYVGLDDGSNGRIAGDSIGDTSLPHAGIDELGNFLGVDNYPLVRPPVPVSVFVENAAYTVAVEGNSTVSTFRFVQAEKKLTFNVTGPTATAGYCNITIPKSLLRDSPWKIVLNGTDITAEAFIAENETHSSIYFTYNHSISNVQIIGTWVVPELSPQTMLTTILIFAASMILLKARKREENNLDSSVQ